MLPTKDLKDVLKDAQAVTSLATTDRVLITDANGEPLRITMANALGNLKSKNFNSIYQDWYTIAQLDKSTAYGGILCVTSGEWCGSPTLDIFAIGGVYNNGNARKPRIQSLLGATQLVKLRVILNGDSLRIDAYCRCRLLTVKALGIFPLQDIAISTSVPSGSTVWEYDFSSSVFGGG